MGSCNKNRHNEQTPLHVDKHHSLSILRKKYGILSSLEINAFLYNDTQNLIIRIFKFGSFYGIECFPALLIYLRCLGSLWISALWHIISGFFFFKYIYIFYIYTHIHISGLRHPSNSSAQELPLNTRHLSWYYLYI